MKTKYWNGHFLKEVREMGQNKIMSKEELIDGLSVFVSRVLNGGIVSDKELEILPETIKILISLMDRHQDLWN